MSKAIVLCAAALCLAGYVFVYATGRAGVPIRSDGFSYYVYLPSWFLFHDTTLAAAARDCCGGEFPGYTAIIRWPGTRRWVNAHPIGVAIMQAPMFAVAHGLTRWTNLSPDGFTFYYQHGAGLSGLILDRPRPLDAPAGPAPPLQRRGHGRHARDDPPRHESLPLRDVRQLVQPRLLVLPLRGVSLSDRTLARHPQPEDGRPPRPHGRPHRPHAAHQRPVPDRLSPLRRRRQDVTSRARAPS